MSSSPPGDGPEVCSTLYRIGLEPTKKLVHLKSQATSLLGFSSIHFIDHIWMKGWMNPPVSSEIWNDLWPVSSLPGDGPEKDPEVSWHHFPDMTFSWLKVFQTGLFLTPFSWHVLYFRHGIIPLKMMRIHGKMSETFTHKTAINSGSMQSDTAYERCRQSRMKYAIPDRSNRPNVYEPQVAIVYQVRCVGPMYSRPGQEGIYSSFSHVADHELPHKKWNQVALPIVNQTGSYGIFCQFFRTF